MGIPSEMRDMWVNNRRRDALLIPSPYEEQKSLRAKTCTQVNLMGSFLSEQNAHVIKVDVTGCLIAVTISMILQRARHGFKAACIWGAVSAVPTLTAVRMIPWAKANVNYTAQALMISAASIAAYFITADKTILECARKNAQLQQALSCQK